MAERKVDWLRHSLSEVSDTDTIDAAVGRVADSIGGDVGQRVRSVLEPSSRDFFVRSVEKLRSAEVSLAEAVGTVLRRAYPNLWMPRNMREAGLAELDSVVLANGGQSGPVGAVLGEVGLDLRADDSPLGTALKGKFVLDATRIEAELATSAAKLTTARDEVAAKRATLERKRQLTDAFEKSKKAFGNEAGLETDLEALEIRELFYSTWQGIEELADVAKVEERDVEFEELIRIAGLFIELMDDRGDYNQLQKEWRAVQGSIAELMGLVETFRSYDGKLCSDLDEKLNELKAYRGSRPKVNVLRGVIRIPTFDGVDEDAIFSNFKEELAHRVNQLRSKATPTDRENLLIAEFDRLTNQAQDRKRYNPGRVQIEHFLTRFQKEIIEMGSTIFFEENMVKEDWLSSDLDGEVTTEEKIKIDKTLADLQAFITDVDSRVSGWAEFETFKTNFGTLVGRGDLRLRNLKDWLEANYAPLARDFEAIDECKLQTKIAQAEGDVVRLEGEKVNLRRSLRNASDPSKLRLVARLLMEAGAVAEIVDLPDDKEELRIFGQKPLDLATPNVRTRIEAAVRRALETLANVKQSDLLARARQLSVISTDAIDQHLSDADRGGKYSLNKNAAIADQVVMIETHIGSLTPPTPVDKLGGREGLKGDDLMKAQAKFDKDKTEFDRAKANLNQAKVKLDRLRLITSESFSNAKGIFEALDAAKKVGVNKSMLPKDYESLRAKYEDSSKRDGVFSVNDLDRLQSMYASLEPYLTEGKLDLLTDSLKDMEMGIKNFGKKPEMFAKSLQVASLKLLDPNLSDREADEGATNVLKANRAARVGSEPEFLGAKVVDIATFQIFAEWLEKAKYKLGDRERSIKATMSDLKDWNNPKKLTELVKGSRLPDYVLAALYVAYEKAAGGVISEQCKIVYEGLVNRALENPKAKQAANAAKLSEDQKLESARNYAKALIDDQSEADSTGGYFDGLADRNQTSLANRQERFEIEVQLLKFQANEGKLLRKDYLAKVRALEKKYELEIPERSFWSKRVENFEYRKARFGHKLSYGAGSVGLAAGESVARGLAGVATWLSSKAWNATAGKLTGGFLNVNAAQAAKTVTGSFVGAVKRNYGLMDKFLNVHTEEEVNLKDRLETLTKEADEAKFETSILDGGIKAEDFFISSAEEPEESKAA